MSLIDSLLERGFTQETLNHLQEQGFTPELLTVLLALNFSAKAIIGLEKLGFSSSTVIDIGKCPTLVKMLNEFVSTTDPTFDSASDPDNPRATENGKFQVIYGGSKYSDKDNRHIVYISEDALDLCQPYPHKRDQSQAVIELAHEVGHALSKIRFDNSSAEARAYSSKQWEAEALYYEMIARVEIYPETQVYKVSRWEDDQERPIGENDPGVDMYNRFKEIVYGSASGEVAKKDPNNSAPTQA